jgi:hypothetical protein
MCQSDYNIQLIHVWRIFAFLDDEEGEEGEEGENVFEFLKGQCQMNRVQYKKWAHT